MVDTSVYKKASPWNIARSGMGELNSWQVSATLHFRYGVEEKYNQLLSGSPVEVQVALDPYKINDIPDVPPGASLVLTIDRDIQAMTERILDQHVTSSGSKSGAVVIMDPENGEILAMAVSDRVVLMNAGRIEQVGTPAQVFEEPASPFVMRFLGAVNVFRGHVDGGRAYVGDLEFSAPALREREPAHVFVRPHELEISVAPVPGSFAAEVERVTVLGASVNRH